MLARAISVPCFDHFILYSDASTERLKLAIIDGQRPDRKLIPQETPRILKDIMVHLSALEATFIKSLNPLLCKQKEFVYSLKIS